MLKPFVCTRRAALVLTLLVPTVANAQFDHLRCFKIKDQVNFNAQAVLSALQARFGVNESCAIQGKGKLFCVPVSKTVTEFTDKTKDGIPQVPLGGEELVNDRVCYKIKCPEAAIAPEVITDQFGTRTVEKFRSQLLCTPAIQGPPTCTPQCAGRNCGDDGCGGSCGVCDAGIICDVGSGTCITGTCTPQCAGRNCGDDGCGGSCGVCEAGIICDIGSGTCVN